MTLRERIAELELRVRQLEEELAVLRGGPGTYACTQCGRLHERQKAPKHGALRNAGYCSDCRHEADKRDKRNWWRKNRRTSTKPLRAQVLK